jgi:hypothetical protein
VPLPPQKHRTNRVAGMRQPKSREKQKKKKKKKDQAVPGSSQFSSERSRKRVGRETCWVCFCLQVASMAKQRVGVLQVSQLLQPAVSQASVDTGLRPINFGVINPRPNKL